MSKSVQEGVASACDSIPNLQIPAGGSIPIELPANIKLPNVEVLKEKLTTIPEFKIEIDSELVKKEVS